MSEEFRQVAFVQQGVSQYAQYLSRGSAKMEFVFKGCNETVCEDGDTSLYPGSILGISLERLDLEILLDPFEEKFYLPAVVVKQGDILGSGVEVVGKVDEILLKVGA